MFKFKFNVTSRAWEIVKEIKEKNVERLTGMGNTLYHWWECYWAEAWKKAYKEMKKAKKKFWTEFNKQAKKDFQWTAFRPGIEENKGNTLFKQDFQWVAKDETGTIIWAGTANFKHKRISRRLIDKKIKCFEFWNEEENYWETIFEF